MTSVHCAQCDTLLEERPNTPPDERSPCPNCGSTARRNKVQLKEQLTPHDQLRYKGRSNGTRKPFVEGLVGADWSHRLGRWVRKVRIIDRRSNRYRETVTDPQTGEVIHDADEPLSDHRSHGSDKPAV